MWLLTGGSREPVDEDVAVSPPAVADDHSNRAKGRRRSRWSWLVDGALLAAAYGIYTLVRNTVPDRRADALAHARALLHGEQVLHLDPERALNRALATDPVLANVADYYYATMHFVVVIAVMVWLYTRRNAVARRWAAAWYAMNLLGLLGFWLLPTAPPRLLPGAGFVDTVVRFHTWGSWGDGAVASASNQYAAFPSLHEGWALWAAITVAMNTRRRWLRVAAFGYPLATGLVVLGTANHYLVDVAAGVLTCLLGFAAVQAVPALGRLRAAASSRQPALSWRRRPVLTAAVVLVLAAVAGGAAAGVLAQRRTSRQRLAARRVSTAYLADWAAGRYTSLAQLTDQPGTAVTGYYEATMRRLHASGGQFQLGAVRLGSRPRASFTARLDIEGYGDWSYAGQLPLSRRSDGRWQVAWTPAALHPALRLGDELALEVGAPVPGHVLDDTGARIRGADSALTGSILGAPAGTAAGPKLLASQLSARLTGKGAATITVLDEAGRIASRLHTFAAVPGVNVRTTLDLRLQQLAEQVVDDASGPTSLVAVDTGTGAVKAVADNPQAGQRTALSGRFAPGSTFKIVTATAALENGYTLDSTVNCPPTINGGGFTFHNAGGESYGPITFRKAFAVSCNTAFIGIAESLPKSALAHAAAYYGCTVLPAGAPQKRALTIPSFACNYPPADGAEYAASAFGQGQDQVSPLGMTMICAAAASGDWHPPTLLPSGTLRAPASPLPATVVAELHTAMRSVVTSGTATSIAATPIAGKTGTAEYGTADPPATNAWFTGYLDHYAVTVLVQNGGYGGDAAAPLAARFLTAAQAAVPS